MAKNSKQVSRNDAGTLESPTLTVIAWSNFGQEIILSLQPERTDERGILVKINNSFLRKIKLQTLYSLAKKAKRGFVLIKIKGINFFIKSNHLSSTLRKLTNYYKNRNEEKIGRAHV